MSAEQDPAHQTVTANQSGHPAQLRIALVCYGGVSLAIYMHGVTKELHKLVVASEAFQRNPAENPFEQLTDTEWAYFETLAELARRRRPIEVTVDVISGTSAGGINGVCLAKVLARNGSQEGLKKLWIEQADLENLLTKQVLDSLVGGLIRTSEHVLRRMDEPVSLLRGDLMSRLLFRAIQGMDQKPGAEPSLLPAGGTIDLYVTTTDLNGFPVLVPTGAGGASQQETNHHQVLAFHGQADGTGHFEPGSEAALAFAGRATSCFPGAFKPVSLLSFVDELGAEKIDGERIDTSGIDPYAAAERFCNRFTDGVHTSDDAWFVDGGLLDNAPFDLAVNAIAAKPAQSEVLRRLVYIQPDPGVAPGRILDVPDQSEPPGWAHATLKAALSVRGTHSILPALVGLRDLNLRIAEVGALAARQEDQVRTATEEAWADAKGSTGTAWQITSLAQVEALANAFYKKAPAFMGAGFPGYCQLKVEEVARGLSAKISASFRLPAESNHASFIQATVCAWARSRAIDTANGFDTTKLLDLLGPIDMPYRERRLMFILAGINEFYAVAGQPDRPTRGQIDALKSAAWELLTNLRAGTAAAVDGLGTATDFLRAPGLDVFADPEGFAKERGTEFEALYSAYTRGVQANVASSTKKMWGAFGTHTRDWSDEDRKSLLNRYLGFPLWDALLFPTLALSRLPQYSPIAVSQFSPLAAAAIDWPREKLKGVGLGHFAAFLQVGWRQNDYLWGRLDATELILRALRDVLTPEDVVAPTMTDPKDARRAALQQAGPHLRQALNAVRESESDLTALEAGLADELWNKIEELPTWGP